MDGTDVVRKNKVVRPLMVEIEDNIYKGLERYSKKWGWSKRRIIEDAINCWVVQRDMESKAREGDV